MGVSQKHTGEALQGRAGMQAQGCGRSEEGELAGERRQSQHSIALPGLLLKTKPWVSTV